MNHDIRKLVAKHGIKNIVVVDTEDGRPMTLTEKRYKLSENFKVTVTWEADGAERAHHYYISDFNKLLKQGYLEVHVHNNENIYKAV